MWCSATCCRMHAISCLNPLTQTRENPEILKTIDHSDTEGLTAIWIALEVTLSADLQRPLRGKKSLESTFQTSSVFSQDIQKSNEFDERAHCSCISLFSLAIRALALQLNQQEEHQGDKSFKYFFLNDEISRILDCQENTEQKIFYVASHSASILQNSGAAAKQKQHNFSSIIILGFKFENFSCVIEFPSVGISTHLSL